MRMRRRSLDYYAEQIDRLQRLTMLLWGSRMDSLGAGANSAAASSDDD
jgi:hypothetical protein